MSAAFGFPLVFSNVLTRTVTGSSLSMSSLTTNENETFNALSTNQHLGILKNAVLTKLHGVGGLSKIFSKKMLTIASKLAQEEHLPESIENTDDGKAAKLFVERGYFDEIMRWCGTNGRRFNSDYLQEVLQGEPWSINPIFTVFFTLQLVNDVYKHIPMAFCCYGGFQRSRYGKDRSGHERDWDVVFHNNAELEQLSKDGSVAEIEVVITNNSHSKKWAGTIAFESALCDIISRKRSGDARYKAIVIFTGARELRGVALKHGFTQVQYSYSETGTSTSRRAALPADSIRDKLAFVYFNRHHAAASVRVPATRNLLQLIVSGDELEKQRKDCNPVVSRASWRKCN